MFLVHGPAKQPEVHVEVVLAAQQGTPSGLPWGLFARLLFFLLRFAHVPFTGQSDVNQFLLVLRLRLRPGLLELLDQLLVFRLLHATLLLAGALCLYLGACVDDHRRLVDVGRRCASGFQLDVELLVRHEFRHLDLALGRNWIRAHKYEHGLLRRVVRNYLVGQRDAVSFNSLQQGLQQQVAHRVGLVCAVLELHLFAGGLELDDDADLFWARILLSQSVACVRICSQQGAPQLGKSGYAVAQLLVETGIGDLVALDTAVEDLVDGWGCVVAH